MRNKTKLYIAFVMLLGMTIIQGCASKGNGNPSIEQENTADESGQSLNDIRFRDWKDEDWIDNDYIRALRAYLDDFNSGTISDEILDLHKDIVKGKFVVGDAEPFIAGGLLVRFMFVDHPNVMFGAWIYSGVDEVKEVVTDYNVRSIQVESDDLPYTKEEIISINKEHPEMKFW